MTRVLRERGPGPIRAVLLDKDGTLVDFRASWLPALERAAHALTRDRRLPPHTAARLLALGGYREDTGTWDPHGLIACATTRDLADAWADALGGGDAARIEALLEATFDRDVRAAPIAVTGAAAALARLRARGIALGVATMDTERGARDTLRRLGIADLFAFVCGCDSGFGEKPGPGMVDAFCTQVAVTAAAVAVVGDTTHDTEMGARSGAAVVVGVLSGASGHAALAPHCHHVIDSVADLETVL